MLVTVIIPIAVHHQAISKAAISSVQSQTVQCGLVPVIDEHQHGAGWARNYGATVFKSDFLLFLDADDQLRPDALELMFKHYQRGKYVYCDDMQGDSLHQTSDLGHYDGTWWHSISALIPVIAFKAIGGFDETLPALEDMDFFLRLQAAGCCGVRCPHPLLSYTPYGQRSKIKQTNNSLYQSLKDTIVRRWSGAAKMGCGCGTPVSGQIPDGKQDSDILVTALYTPRQVGGPATGRLYPRPRGTNNYQIWVDPQDADHPTGKTMWSPVKTVDPNAAPAVEDVVRMANEALMAK